MKVIESFECYRNKFSLDCKGIQIVAQDSKQVYVEFNFATSVDRPIVAPQPAIGGRMRSVYVCPPITAWGSSQAQTFASAYRSLQVWYGYVTVRSVF